MTGNSVYNSQLFFLSISILPGANREKKTRRECQHGTDSKEHSWHLSGLEDETGQMAVDFDGLNDLMNPLNRNLMYKWTLVVVLSLLFTFTA